MRKQAENDTRNKPATIIQPRSMKTSLQFTLIIVDSDRYLKQENDQKFNLYMV